MTHPTFSIPAPDPKELGAQLKSVQDRLAELKAEPVAGPGTDLAARIPGADVEIVRAKFRDACEYVETLQRSFTWLKGSVDLAAELQQTPDPTDFMARVRRAVERVLAPAQSPDHIRGEIVEVERKVGDDGRGSALASLVHQGRLGDRPGRGVPWPVAG